MGKPGITKAYKLATWEAVAASLSDHQYGLHRAIFDEPVHTVVCETEYLSQELRLYRPESPAGGFVLVVTKSKIPGVSADCVYPKNLEDLQREHAHRRNTDDERSFSDTVEGLYRWRNEYLGNLGR